MERVLEIVNYLMKQGMLSSDRPGEGDQLTQALEELGYDSNEIETALRLFTSFANAWDKGTEQGSVTFRIFSAREEERFSLAFREEVLRLGRLNLLSKHELEELLMEAFLLETREVGLKELDQLLHKIVKNEERLWMIAPHLSGFEQFLMPN